jgi:hypothetical protein
MSKQLETVARTLAPFANGHKAEHLVTLQGDKLFVHAETFMGLFGDDLAHSASLEGVHQSAHGAMVRVTRRVANLATDSAIDQLEASEDKAEKAQVRLVIKLAKALTQVVG